MYCFPSEVRRFAIGSFVIEEVHLAVIFNVLYLIIP